MDQSLFDLEIKRLQNQWPSAYQNERIAALWNAFKDYSIEHFREAVSQCLLTERGAPLFEQLSKALEAARGRDAELKARYGWSQTTGANLAILAEAAKKTDASKPFVEDCMGILKAYHRGEITREQFNAKCDLLESAARQRMKSYVPPKGGGHEPRAYRDD